MPGITKEQFLREFSPIVMEGNAALFAGAGLSIPAGFVNWHELLKEIADDIGLDVKIEHDLIAIAQYHVNSRRNRTKLNRKLIEEFTKNARPTINHQLIAQLPIHTVWTTNYDTLLEDAFKTNNKSIDTKTTQDNIALMRPGTDVTIFKMHGDISQPGDAVLTKEDYETYHLHRELFTIRLKSDLITYTFLFLGFSFSDPNIDYILSRIRSLFRENVPTHYCIMKKPESPKSATTDQKAQYEYEKVKLDLRVEDLKRYGIQTVLIDSYHEITEILEELNNKAFLHNVFVSGSAVIGTDAFDYPRLQKFSQSLGKSIIENNMNLVSGYGLGIGNEVLTGATVGTYLSSSSMRERLILRPFPISVKESQKQEVYTKWRMDMLSISGFCIFIAGNKKDSDSIKIADGVIAEFDLSTEKPRRCFPIPVGATGYAAEIIWRIVKSKLSTYYPEINVKSEMKILGNPENSDDELLKSIFSIISKVTKNNA